MNRLYEFEEQTIKVLIDDSLCPECETKACVKACSLYSRGILKIEDGKPRLAVQPADAKRLGTECLACEYECWFRGRGAIRIEVPIKGLEEYRRRVGLGSGGL